MAPKQRIIVGSSSGAEIPINPLVTKFCERNEKKKVKYSVKKEANANLKFKDLTDGEKHAFRERLSKLQHRQCLVPRVIDWDLFDECECEDELRSMMRTSYVYPGDGDSFNDLSWERAFSVNEEVYREWCMEFFSTMYFERKVNVRNLMSEICIWFRLCGRDHAYTLPAFGVALGLYEPHEVNHRLFETHFSRLRRFEKDYPSIPAYWNQVGDPSCARRNASTIRNPLMRILHKLIVTGPFNRFGSRDKCQKPDLWIMKLLEETKDGNAIWQVAEYLSRRAPGIKSNSNICGGHFVTRLAKNLGYYVDEELAKCGEPKYSETWTAKGFGNALNRRLKTVGLWVEPRPQQQPPQQQPQQQQGNIPMENVQMGTSSSFDSGWGEWNQHLDEIQCRDVWRDSMMLRNNYINDYSMPIFQHMAREANYELPPYNPPNVPPYPFPYTSYPGPYPYPYPGYAPFPDPIPPYGRLPEAGGTSYEVGGSSSGVGGKKKKRRVRSEIIDENYVTESDDDDEFDDEEGEEMSEDDE